MYKSKIYFPILCLHFTGKKIQTLKRRFQKNIYI